jgi:spore maturation protein CgeB
MKILIYDVDCKSSGVTYPIKVVLESIGHQAVMFDWTLYFNTVNLPNVVNKIKNKIGLRFIQSKINLDLLKVIDSIKFDLFIVMRGDHIYPDTLKFAKSKIPIMVNWNTDDLFNDLNSSRLIKESIPLYDIHFSPRFNLKNEYLSKGAKSFVRLDWYYRYGINYNEFAKQSREYFHESTFIGSWSQRREMYLSKLMENNLDIFGWGWNKKINSNIYFNWSFSPSISIKQMHREFFHSKININILTLENRDTTNLRNFEIPASMGFQLSERSNEILDLFEEDKEIVCFSSMEELTDKYNFYLKNENLRVKIAKSGTKKLFENNNSLKDRLDKIINIINN